MTNPTCCKLVRRYLERASPCGKPGKFEREGKWYCGIHDPQKRADRIASDIAVADDRIAARLRRESIDAAGKAVVEAAKVWAETLPPAHRDLHPLLIAVNALTKLENSL